MIDKKINFPILNIQFNELFDHLSNEEKLYTYYMNKACWDGALILLFQTSYESPPLFIIFQTFFSSIQPFEIIKKQIFLNSNGKITDVNYKQFISYSAKFYSNMGNYSHLDKCKFIPELESDRFEEILKCSDKFNEIKYIWDCIKDIVYDNSIHYKTIDLRENNGMNAYYLGDLKRENIEFIDEFLKSKNKELLNTRLMMINQNKFAYLVASVEEKLEEWDDTQIIGYYGEFSPFLGRINENLNKAKEFCSNDNQIKMIDNYIKSFISGSIVDHIESQKNWIDDKNPSIEVNIGWFGNSLDPLGKRANYQAFLGILDKDNTKKFGSLVENLELFLNNLPWSYEFERFPVSPSHFSALDVICFCSNLRSSGINLPIYTEMIENSKNISFLNSLPSFCDINLDYYVDKDKELLKNIGKRTYIMFIALKKVLGQSSGKLFKKLENGELNFKLNEILNPVTNEFIEKYYDVNETYDSKFKELAKFYEECRRDLISLYFCFFKEAHQIFELDENLYKDYIYAIWLMYIKKGISSLCMYKEETNDWGCYPVGEWIFLQFLIEHQLENQEVLIFRFDEEKNEIFINLNKDMIICYGQEIVSKILLNLHIWKCTGDYDSAKSFYDKYSVVNEYFVKLIKIIKINRYSKNLELYNNLEIDLDKNIQIIDYPVTMEGIINSYVDRYGTFYNQDIYNQWTKYDTNFFK